MPTIRSTVAVPCWVALLLLTAGFGTPRLTDRDIVPTISVSTSQLRILDNARQIPELTAQATLLYDVDADQLLFAQNENVALPVASLTKLMTALLVFEAIAQEPTLLTQEVTVRSEDLVGGATMGLLGGERRTVEDLLYGLLIPSGNDAATALARYLGDLQDSGANSALPTADGAAVESSPVARFVARMNQRAAEMGLSQTNFANPHGIDAPGHVSSATDLLVITQTVLNYDFFRQIVQLEEATIGGRPLRNTNQLLGSFLGADGIKTGTTPASGQSLVASITRNRHRVIIIILGSRQRYDDVQALYRYYDQQYTWSDVGGSDDSSNAGLQALNRVRHENGQRWYLATEGELPSRLLPAQAAPTVTSFHRIQLPPPEQIWYRGMRIGILEWRLGNEIIGSQNLTLR